MEFTVLICKKTIFCQIFRLILHESSSVARMTESEKEREKEGYRDEEDNETTME